jgi:hypothetical protein
MGQVTAMRNIIVDEAVFTTLFGPRLRAIEAPSKTGTRRVVAQSGVAPSRSFVRCRCGDVRIVQVPAKVSGNRFGSDAGRVRKPVRRREGGQGVVS